MKKSRMKISQMFLMILLLSASRIVADGSGATAGANREMSQSGSSTTAPATSNKPQSVDGAVKSGPISSLDQMDIPPVPPAKSQPTNSVSSSPAPVKASSSSSSSSPVTTSRNVISPVPPTAQPNLIVDAVMIKDLETKAQDQIVSSARSSDPFLRANAVEASQEMKDRAVPIIQLALSDPSPVVRFTALAVIGKQKLVELAPAAERLQSDESAQVRAAALFALKMCGKKVDISPLAQMLSSQTASVRCNAVMLLGMLGDRSAAPMMRELASIPLRRSSAVETALVHIQVAEAIVKLGDDTALDALRAGAYSQFDEVRVLAVQMMGRLGDRRMERAMIEIMKNPPVELQLASAEALKRLGHDDGLGIAVGSATSTIDTARAQAAFTLGLFKVQYKNDTSTGDARATLALAKLIDDPVEQVRLSAAAAIVSRKN